MRRHWDSLQRALGPSSDATASKDGAVGVVHSFTGTTDELKELLDLGVYIGVNGCSLKTQENLETVRQIPLDRVLLETGTSTWASPLTCRCSVVRNPTDPCIESVRG